MTELSDVLQSVARDYPDADLKTVWKEALCTNLRSIALRDVERTQFHLELIRSLVPPGGTVADIGGGISMFAPGVAAIGYRSILVDDFANGWQAETESVLQAMRARGVEIVTADIVKDSLPFQEGSLDAATSFECIEHLHNSPKAMLHQVVRALRPGGIFLLSAPNCVNLRKRLTLPFGVGKWSRMAHWYEEETFRGHVREPDVDDLKYIARDLGLGDVRIFGRNWMGYISRFSLVRAVTPFADRALRAFPGLCSNIYLLGRKPA